MALRPLSKPRKGDAAVPTTFLVEGGIDLEQQRHAKAASRPDPGREVQVVALVDNIRPQRAHRGGKPVVIGQRVAQLQRLVRGARHPFLETGDVAGIGAEALVLDVPRTHDLDLVPERGQRVNHLLEMHELSVLRADPVVIQDPHAIHVLAMRRNSASCIAIDGPHAKRRA
jgi:hypothetical protein